MERLVRRTGRGEKEHSVYSVEEAEALGMVYRPWRDAVGGEWAQTDDRFVAELLELREYKGAIHNLLFSFGEVWVKKNTTVEWLKWRDVYMKRPKRTWINQEAGKTRTKNMIALYVQMLMSGRVDWNKLGQAYRPDQKIPAATVRRLLKQEEIKEMVQAEIRKTLTDQGVDEKYVIDTIKDAIVLAKNEGDASTMIRGAKEFGEMLEMKNKPSAGNFNPMELPPSDIEQRLIESAEVVDKFVHDRAVKDAELAKEIE
jgi:hypothetical protein